MHYFLPIAINSSYVYCIFGYLIR